MAVILRLQTRLLWYKHISSALLQFYRVSLVPGVCLSVEWLPEVLEALLCSRVNGAGNVRGSWYLCAN